MDEDKVIGATKDWLQEFVIALNLCPFAGRYFSDSTIRYEVHFKESEESLLEKLCDEINYLQVHSQIATTLLIHPHTLTDFPRFNQFLDSVDGLLEGMRCVGEYQVASFHPDYQFVGTEIGDAENFTNRSPYPMLHILRESLVTDAINSHPDIHQIPDDNIKQVREIGTAHLQRQLSILQGLNPEDQK